MTVDASMSPFQKRLATVVCFLIAAAVAISAGAQAEALSAFDFTYPKQRLPAPGFRLHDLNGDTRSLEEFRGRVVLTHFWATFCTPCLHEMPELESLWRRYRQQGLVVLGVAADRGSARPVRDFAEKAGITFPILLDPVGTVRNQYEVMALPMSYLIGRDGKISGRAPGTRKWSDPGGRELIESLLNTGAVD